MGCVDTASYESLGISDGSEARVLGIMWVCPTVRFDGLRAAAVIGRAEGCDVQLHGKQVSRRHATVLRDGAAWLLEDARSKNGTWVDGVCVDRLPLNEQGVVRIGEWVGVVCYMPEAVTRGADGFQTLPPGLLVSASTLAALGRIEAVLQRDIAIIIYGETGTGKDVLARAIHHASGRLGPFIAVNGAAIPEGMAEALLFGHRKGAFTGAQHANEGYLRSAHGGTLFLDEVADLPLAIQGKLLRAVEERAVAPLGGTQLLRADCRIVAACQEPLASLVEGGRFRRDLYARLRGAEVTLPPLRHRRQEIIPLLLRFLRGYGLESPALDPRLVEALCVHDWPHNVRELEQLAAVLAASAKKALTFFDLPERLRRVPPSVEMDVSKAPGAAAVSARRKAWLSRHLHELAKLRTALEKHNGDVTNAALEVGVPRHRARRLLAAEAELADARWR